MTDNRTTEQTATERLRALLDERGVKYEAADAWWTSWDTAGASDVGAVVYCEDLGSGLEIRWHTITPEQAIAVTLGSEREKALEELVLDMYRELREDTTYIDKNGNELELPWVAEYLRPIEQRIAALEIEVIDE